MHLHKFNPHQLSEEQENVNVRKRTTKLAGWMRNTFTLLTYYTNTLSRVYYTHMYIAHGIWYTANTNSLRQTLLFIQIHFTTKEKYNKREIKQQLNKHVTVCVNIEKIIPKHWPCIHTWIRFTYNYILRCSHNNPLSYCTNDILTNTFKIHIHVHYVSVGYMNAVDSKLR